MYVPEILQIPNFTFEFAPLKGGAYLQFFFRSHIGEKEKRNLSIKNGVYRIPGSNHHPDGKKVTYEVLSSGERFATTAIYYVMLIILDGRCKAIGASLEVYFIARIQIHVLD